MRPLRHAIIGLGANIGDRHGQIERALTALRALDGVTEVCPSPIYETAPVGVIDQPQFLNLVALVETNLLPETLLTRLLEIEQSLGRIRSNRWGPRTIDLDLLFYENEERNLPGLTLPHPRWRERSFVTIPLRALLARPDCPPGWRILRQEVEVLPDDPDVRPWHSTG